MNVERRKFTRVKATHPIKVVCTGQVLQGHPQDFIFRNYTENISEKGIKIILEKEIKAGSLVALELFITDKESLPIDCNGVIMWTRKANPDITKPDLFSMGIEFENLTNPVYRKLLLEVINYYLNNNPADNN